MLLHAGDPASVVPFREDSLGTHHARHYGVMIPNVRI
jgi:hypothetical protein